MTTQDVSSNNVNDVFSLINVCVCVYHLYQQIDLLSSVFYMVDHVPGHFMLIFVALHYITFPSHIL